MSKLSVTKIRPRTGAQINIASGTSIAIGDSAFANTPGTPIQMVTSRTDSRGSYSANNQYTPNIITPTAISITPKIDDSLISVKWMLSGEVHQDVVIIILKNGQEFKSHQTSAGQRWSGYCSGYYDRNQSSTQSNWYINVFDDETKAGTENTYTLAVRSSSNGNYTFYLNRTQGSNGQNSYETLATVATALEITK